MYRKISNRVSHPVDIVVIFSFENTFYELSSGTPQPQQKFAKMCLLASSRRSLSLIAFDDTRNDEPILLQL
jgi:hypothetical protein